LSRSRSQVLRLVVLKPKRFSREKVEKIEKGRTKMAWAARTAAGTRAPTRPSKRPKRPEAAAARTRAVRIGLSTKDNRILAREYEAASSRETLEASSAGSSPPCRGTLR
jgi:hypothetical protein